MKFVRYLRDALVFAPCYVALDWASYIDPVGPFNITPWNPQPALAIVWMLLGGIGHAPAVLATIVLADVIVRGAPGGYAITILTAVILTAGYASIAWTLKALAFDARLRTTKQLTIFVTVVAAGTAAVGTAFIALLQVANLLRETSLSNAWLRFWIGDAVGVLVTAPLLFAAVDSTRRAALARQVLKPEALLQLAVLAGTLWVIFEGLGSDPSRHFYLLFLPLIWIAVRLGFNGAILATAIVQVGVVFGIHRQAGLPMPIVELQALMAALTLTGLFLGVMVDERQRAEEGLRQSLRLAAASEMAGAIAHEVNQPLTAVANYGRSAQMLLEQDQARSELMRQTIQKILTEADRASEVVRRLRDFFRAGTTRLEPVAPEEFLRSVRRIGETATDGKAIAIDVKEPPSLPSLLVDRLQIEVILRNLLTNAIESLTASEQPESRIVIRVDQLDDKHLRFVVTDNGPGVSPAVMESLFEPFASGKAAGMGLGLAVSRAIAEAHGGTLEVAHGAHGEFHLVLPCLPRT